MERKDLLLPILIRIMILIPLTLYDLFGFDMIYRYITDVSTETLEGTPLQVHCAAHPDYELLA